MIRFVMPAMEACLLESMDTFGVFGTILYSQYRTYGAQNGVAEFWLLLTDGRVCGAVSRLGGQVTVAAPEMTAAQTAELAEFLRAAGFVSVQGESAVLEQLAAGLQRPLASSWILRQTEQHRERSNLPDGLRMERAASLRVVYELLCACDETFARTARYDAWLCELSHKTRHGLASVFVLYAGKHPVATASILFKSEGQAVLAALATHPAWRGCGFARLLLSAASFEAAQQHLALCVLAGEDELLAFYQTQGFQPIGRWGSFST